MKQKIVTFTFILFFNFLFSNITDDHSVTITTNGNGATLEKARESALLSAITQVCGVYLSQDSTIFNDQLIKDEITSITRGNIEKYSILSEVKIENGDYISTLKVTVSVFNLKTFVESKGYKVEFNGAAFAMNLKLKILNERAEVQCVQSLLNNLIEPLQLAFDYTINSKDPISVNNSNDLWEISSIVTIKANKNMEFCANLHNETLKAISLDESEIESYKLLNKKIYKYAVMYGNTVKEFSFRSPETIELLKAIDNRKYVFSDNFTIIRNTSITIPHKNNFFEYGRKYYGFPWSSSGDINYMYAYSLEYYTSKFFKNGEFVNEYSFFENFSLQEIEKFKEYVVKSNGITIKLKQGGYVLENDLEHGIATTMVSFTEQNWENAKKICADLTYNGYNDWRLPTYQELEIIKNKFGNILNPESNFYYWSLSYPYGSFIDDGIRVNLSDFALGCCYSVPERNRLRLDYEFPGTLESYKYDIKLKTEKIKFIAVRNY